MEIRSGRCVLEFGSFVDDDVLGDDDPPMVCCSSEECFKDDLIYFDWSLAIFRWRSVIVPPDYNSIK